MTTPGNRAVAVDHDEIAAVTKNMDDALALFKDVDAQLDAVITSMENDARGANGEIAPVYVPLVNATREAMERIKAGLASVRDTMSSHNATLAEFSQSAANTAGESAVNIDSVN